jgi:hypothetical protein
MHKNDWNRPAGVPCDFIVPFMNKAGFLKPASGSARLFAPCVSLSK